MSDQAKSQSGPDLTKGIALLDLEKGRPVVGHVGDEAVLLVKRDREYHAIGATCTHYSGPLAEGLIVGDTVRCPWHHACFSLKTGEALRAPALNPVKRWKTEVRGDRVYVSEEARPGPTRRPPANAPGRVVIVGAGAAGGAAAEMLRREGFSGSITMVGADPDIPYDRPNCSKDYLAGNAPEEWMPLWPVDFYQKREIDLRTGKRVTAIDVRNRSVAMDDGESLRFDALLLATGAEPIRLNIPGNGLPDVFTLRSMRDSKAIIAAAEKAQRAVVIGASFIGLEVAASLRARKLEVDVVAPEKTPLEKVLGPELGRHIQKVHEDHGVKFHLERTVKSIEKREVTLSDGTRLKSGLVVMGVGVRPSVQLAEAAGLEVENGVLVNEYLQTSAPGIYAAGDIARWPDPHSGQRLRIEHWVVAERMGQTAARNIIGLRQRFDTVPFFWSAHYDVTVNYIGHAEKWDRLVIDGDIGKNDCRVEYRQGEKTLAVATIGRDQESLKKEAEMEAAVGAK